MLHYSGFVLEPAKTRASLDASPKQKSAGVHGHASNFNSSELLAGLKLRPH